MSDGAAAAAQSSRIGTSRLAAIAPRFKTIAEEDALGRRSDHSNAVASRSDHSRSDHSQLGNRSNHSQQLGNRSNHSQQRTGAHEANTINRKKSILRYVWGSRTDDYRDDAPSNARHAVDENHRRSPIDRDSSQEVQDYRTTSNPKWQNCLSCMTSACRPPRFLLQLMSRLLASRLWQICSFFFTMLLLFGAQVRELWIPKGGDIVFDVLFSAAFVFFVIEIILRIYVEPRYFALDLCGRSLSDEEPTAWGRFRIGSFMFWCDLISTGTLLYVISFINRRRFAVATVDIELNQNGIPKSGLDQTSRLVPVDLQIDLLVTIARTTRVARFIRASAVVKTSSKVNWYAVFQRLDPLWYWQRYRRSGSQDQTSMDSSNGTVSSFSERESRIQRRNQLLRRSSWGVLSIGALAAVKAKRQADQQRTKKEQVRATWKRWLQDLGIFSHENDELRRQIAATRIQRAWRATINRHADEDAESHHSKDVAWEGRHSTSNFDRVLAARSILRQNASLNYRKPRSHGPNIRGVSSVSAANPLKRRSESQVGSAMRELTGQRVAIGIIVALVLTVLFTYSEEDASLQSTMVVLHNQTQNPNFANMALDAARSSSIPDLFEYVFTNGDVKMFPIRNHKEDLRDLEILKISVTDSLGRTTVGKFSKRDDERDEALVQLLSTIFILLIWFVGVTAFAGPVMTLVVIPIERMVRLLGMLMVDPLGYQSTKRYKKFIAEQDEFTRNTRWTNEVLKGMETSFLMSTISRIGSLMKVGFGSAGVEIIKNNLEKGSKNLLILSSQGSTVSCIFLFCDIRQFTDATECLQEEVFVFTNRIAAVVHSICHSYGGSANKNVGDAFLLSWMLEDDVDSSKHGPGGNRASSDFRGSHVRDSFVAKNFQADKALLSVVKICIALHHDQYYMEALSENARDALLAKIAGRKGPVVQMGFGLHAGKAVQGAIGSQRKIDATYVSEAVERAEFLESSTKKYGVRMLMSDSFHRLLHPSNRRRCRKIDQIILKNDDDDDEDQTAYDQSDIMELLTFDMDIDALWKAPPKKPDAGDNSDEETPDVGSKRDVLRVTQVRQASGGLLKNARRRSLNRPKMDGSEDLNKSILDAAAIVASQVNQGEQGEETAQGPPELVLPTGPALYSANVWLSEDMRKIRQLYSDGLFFQKFNSGLQSFYAKDWEHAKQCFQTILERFEDGPSRYFMDEIESHNGMPPRNFLGYGIA